MKDERFAAQVSFVGHLRLEMKGWAVQPSLHGLLKSWQVCHLCLYHQTTSHVTYNEGIIQSIADGKGLILQPPLLTQSLSHCQFNRNNPTTAEKRVDIPTFDLVLGTAYRSQPPGHAMHTTLLKSLPHTTSDPYYGDDVSSHALFQEERMWYESKSRLEEAIYGDGHHDVKRHSNPLSSSQTTRDKRFHKTWQVIFNIVRDSCLSFVESRLRLHVVGNVNGAPSQFKFHTKGVGCCLLSKEQPDCVCPWA